VKPGLFAAVALALGGLAAPAVAQVQPLCRDDISHAAVREAVTYDSGGRQVNAWLYRPARPNGAGVVMLHGAGGLDIDQVLFDPHAVQLASRGYHVLAPSYFDAERPEGRRSSRTVRTWRRAVSDGVRFLNDQPGMRGRVALWGYSLGGFLAVETAMETTAAASAIALASGDVVGEPGRDRRALPVLLIHARRDPVVPAGSTRDWGAGLGRRGARVDIQTLDWEGHGFDRPTWCDVFDRTRVFLDSTLLAQRPEGQSQ
jgi:dienelactone hydrolase